MRLLISELKLRGILKDKTSGIEDFFRTSNDLKCYCGTDPTASSLHVGHLIPIITLLRFAKYKYEPYFLLGGATGMIGDPSFKQSERKFLDFDEITTNKNCIKKQVENIFKNNGFNVKFVDNAEWHSKMNVIDFLREGKNMTVNYMSAKESVKKRIVGGMSFTEFSYQLLQAYDFYYLNENFGVNLQIGGADQWGNITSGIDFIRKKTGKEVHAFTIKLLTKKDGNKFGKTENGTIWLDKMKTSAYEFYQFWINRDDVEIVDLYKMFSLKKIDEVEKNIEEHLKNSCCKNTLQKKLAEEMTILVHGEKEMVNSKRISEIIFGERCFDEIKNVENIKENLKNLENAEIRKDEIKNCKTVYDFLCCACIPILFKSKSDVKRNLINKSIFINKKHIENEYEIINNDIFINDFILIQKGKKKFFVVFIK